MSKEKEDSDKTGKDSPGEDRPNNGVYEIEEQESYEAAAAAAGRDAEPIAPGRGRTGEEAAPAKTQGGKPDRARHTARKDAAAGAERAAEEISKLEEEAETLRAEAKDLKDKWLRSVAEFDNYRKRTRKEWDLLQQRTKADLVLNALSVVDDFERAFSVAGDRDDDFVRGIRLIYNKMTAWLEEAGVSKMQALGAEFEPAYHMAVAQIEREGAESNTVVEVVEEGYSLGDIVIRPAKVVIAK